MKKSLSSSPSYFSTHSLIGLTSNEEYSLHLNNDDSYDEPLLLRQPNGTEVLAQAIAEDDSENTTKERGESSHVIEYERWECIVKEINQSGIRVYATDSKKQYSSRFFTFKSQYFEKKSLESVDSIYEGQRFEWVLKRVKSRVGQETNIEEINVYKRIRKPEWQLKLEVEQQMKDLEFLFQE